MSKLVELRNRKGVYASELKASYIDSIISMAPDYKDIKQIVLFGSALEERCNEESDIDLLFVADGVESKLFRGTWLSKFKGRIFAMDWDQEYDFLYVGRSTDNLSGLFAEEIKKKGAVIYDKE